MKKRFDIYEMVTDNIIKALENDIVPWNKTWQQGGLPMNLTTKKPYRGINPFLLRLQPFASPYWLTFNQIRKIKNAQLVKGQKATPIVFWKFCESKETDETTGLKKKFAMLKYYNVFNVEQTEGLEYPKLDELNFEPIVDCENITSKMKKSPRFEFGGNRAFYDKENDKIGLPNKEQFESAESFYATKFHELIHSTGHTSRLNRKTLMDSKGILFAGDDYSNEELVAELGASFLSALTGIGEKVIENQTAYIKGWLEQLRNDKKLIVSASGKAQSAVDYIIDAQFNY